MGRVTACHGGWVFPDSNAHGHGENPEHLYTVVFTGEMLWGDAAERGIAISLDLFESYLETAPAGQENSDP
jgi:nitrile hydratase